jgi:MYXO-CTERM domain-containing protein
MYKIAHLYPNLVAYHQTADTYLMRAFHILNTLYTNTGIYGLSDAGAAGTGYMGEQTLPEIEQALSAAGHAAEAQAVAGILVQIHQTAAANPYPYGSEYTYDNTGEEAVYTAGKAAGDTTMMAKVNAKTRACRGQEPVWYYYADPVTINGEAWWQFQYTAALAGYCMDDWLRSHSSTPEVDERLSYAAKIANVGAINSGQIDSDPANLGTVAWTYQAMKGNVYRGSAETTNGATAALHNDWREMAGEADLGLWGAIRILSADVAVDPIFGLTGYGCNVSESSGCYAVTPVDGVFKRLNLITEGLGVVLDRDRYSGATVSPSKDYFGFTLVNQTEDAHTTNVALTGFAAGTYAVSVDGSDIANVTAAPGQPLTVALAVGAGATHSIRIGSGCGGATTGTDAGPAVPDGGSAGYFSDGGGVAPDDGEDATSGGAGSDAGSTTGSRSGPGGASGGFGAPNGSSSGCGCSSVGATAALGPWAIVGLAAAAGLVVRRRSRSRGTNGSRRDPGSGADGF